MKKPFYIEKPKAFNWLYVVVIICFGLLTMTVVLGGVILAIHKTK